MKSTYIECGYVVSITVCIVLSAEEKERYQWYTNFTSAVTVYPRDEGVVWARRWKSKAAAALRVVEALS